MLKDLPIVSSADYCLEEDEDETIYSQHGEIKLNDASLHEQISKLKLFDNKNQSEKAGQLLASNDPYLVDLISKTLAQIDTSKM